jgi:hypothetical protein
MDVKEKIIVKHGEFFAQALDIKIKSSDILNKINAFDWYDLCDSKTAEEYLLIITGVYNRFNFKCSKQHFEIVFAAFVVLFNEAVKDIKNGIEHVSKSYNVESSGSGFRNDIVDKYYYIEYWANKKNIPVNYSEKDQTKRNLFNFDTILLSILSDKLAAFNSYELNKPKK